MRTLSLALATSTTVFASGVTEVAAVDYRYCIQGEYLPGSAAIVASPAMSGRTACCGADRRFPNVVPTDPTRQRYHSMGVGKCRLGRYVAQVVQQKSGQQSGLRAARESQEAGGQATDHSVV